MVTVHTSDILWHPLNAIQLWSFAMPCGGSRPMQQCIMNGSGAYKFSGRVNKCFELDWYVKYNEREVNII